MPPEEPEVNAERDECGDTETLDVQHDPPEKASAQVDTMHQALFMVYAPGSKPRPFHGSRCSLGGSEPLSPSAPRPSPGPPVGRSLAAGPPLRPREAQTQARPHAN